MKGLHTKAIVLFIINVLNKNKFTTHYIKSVTAWPDLIFMKNTFENAIRPFSLNMHELKYIVALLCQHIRY